MKLILLLYLFIYVAIYYFQAKDKETKRSTLLELVNYLTVYKPSLTDLELDEIFTMLSFNLFRPFQRSMLEQFGM